MRCTSPSVGLWSDAAQNDPPSVHQYDGPEALAESSRAVSVPVDVFQLFLVAMSILCLMMLTGHPSSRIVVHGAAIAALVYLMPRRPFKSLRSFPRRANRGVEEAPRVVEEAPRVVEEAPRVVEEAPEKELRVRKNHMDIILEKTTMCNDYQLGNCPRGASCCFAHHESELRLCVPWKNGGFCVFGDHCKFAHGVEELRDIPGARGRRGEARLKGFDEAWAELQTGKDESTKVTAELQTSKGPVADRQGQVFAQNRAQTILDELPSRSGQDGQTGPPPLEAPAIATRKRRWNSARASTPAPPESPE